MSSSTIYNSEFLGHVSGRLADFLAECESLVFVPYALSDWDSYTARVRHALAGTCDVVGAHTVPAEECAGAAAFFVGGGNTFRLLRVLDDTGLLPVIRSAVAGGSAYLGASAGTVVAGPTIMTTNDMPIVEPRSFGSLGLVGFQLNCHFLDSPPGPRSYMAETREERLEQFLEENDREVVCLREPAWLEIDGQTARVCGEGGGRLYRRDAEPRELATGETSHSLETWCAT
ncbi:MAG: dipeptidase PepE [Actinomycetota bacterium]|jgi:dipeptidase E|nr:dipeptidase PepE [Actinomycetota bacterium]